LLCDGYEGRIVGHRILLVYKNLAASRGVSSHVGLGVTAQNAARVLRTLPGVESVEVTPAFDGYELRDLLLPNRRHITHVVMFAPWVDTPFLQGLLRRFPFISFAVLFHSNVGFLQADRYAVKLAREQCELALINHNFRIAANCERLRDAIAAAFGRTAQLLPNLYPIGPKPHEQHVYHRGDVLRLGVFGAMRAQKNMLTAAWACLAIARRLGARCEIAINSGRVEGGESVLGAIRELVAGLHRVSLCEVGWLTWAQFRTYIATQHLLVSPSYTESFCNVIADGVAEGVPAAVSSAIHWTPKRWQADADDVGSVANVGLKLLGDHGAAADGFKALRDHNKAAAAAWLAWLRISAVSGF
jgi:hypothetical protein